MENNYQDPNTLPKNVRDERMYGMLCHILAFAGFVIPLGNFLGPIIMWQMKKNEFEFVDDQGKESVNFQISMFIYFMLCVPLIFIVIGIPIMIGLGIFYLVIIIIAAIKANDGIRYRYPLSIKFIK